MHSSWCYVNVWKVITADVKQSGFDFWLEKKNTPENEEHTKQRNVLDFLITEEHNNDISIA